MKTRRITILSSEEMKQEKINRSDSDSEIHSGTHTCGSGANSTKFEATCPGSSSKSIYCFGVKSQSITKTIKGKSYLHYLKCECEEGNDIKYVKSEYCDLSEFVSGTGSGATNRYDACKDKPNGTPCEWTDIEGGFHFGKCDYVNELNTKKACRAFGEDWPPKD